MIEADEKDDTKEINDIWSEANFLFFNDLYTDLFPDFLAKPDVGEE